MGFVRTAGRSVTIAVAVVVATVVSPAAPAAAALPSCTLDQLIPQVADSMFDQGLPSYPKGVRGKEGLVKFFLVLPSTCKVGATQSIKITAANLQVDNKTDPASIVPAFQSFASTPTVGATLQTNSIADPIFAVPGGMLAPGLPGSVPAVNGFSATFTATISFTAKSGTSTKPGTIAPAPVVTKAFEKLTKAPRVLVVPMGDASLSYGSQFSPTAQATVQSAMATASRMLPVPAGLGALTSSTGGLRYTIDGAAMLDLRKVANAYVGTPNGNRFCGSSANFDAIKAQLAQFMQSWNTANPAATADRVLGVVDENISIGPESGCAQGMASVISLEAWGRAIADKPASGSTPAQPSPTGPLFVMELLHTSGVVPPVRQPALTYHSVNTQADGTAPDRGYNMSTRSFVQYDKTATRLDTSTPWDNTTTLLERDDQADVLCFLGGAIPSSPVLTNCGPLGTIQGSLGTASGVAAGPTFVMSGTTDGTPLNTKVVESYFTTDASVGVAHVVTPDPDSRYRLIQCATPSCSGGTPSNLGVPVTFKNSDHAAGSTIDPAIGRFSVAFEGLSGPMTIRLVKLGATSDPFALDVTLLYERAKQASPPTFGSGAITTVPPGTPTNYTNTQFRDDVEPALSPNKRFVAWVALENGAQCIHVAPATDANAWQLVPPCTVPIILAVSTIPSTAEQSEPAWSADGMFLAYVQDAELYKVAFDTTGPSPLVGSPTKVFTNDPFRWTRQFGTAGSDRALGVAAHGDVYVAGADGGQASLRKFGPDGTFAWAQLFGDSDASDEATGVATDGLSAFVVGNTKGSVAGTANAGGSDGFVRKYDADGTVVWTDQFGSDQDELVKGVALDFTDLYVVGSTFGTLASGERTEGDTSNHAFIRRYDVSGPTPVVVWMHQFGTSGNTVGSGVATVFGSIYLGGYTFGALPGQTNAGGLDAFVRKYNAAGVAQWTTEFGSTDLENTSGVAADTQGVYLAGSTLGSLGGTNAGLADAFVARLSPTTGALQWTRQFGSSGTDTGLAAALDAQSGGVFVGGPTNGVLPGKTSAGGQDAFVRFYDPNGVEVWTRQFGTSADDELFGLASDEQTKTLYVAGETQGQLNGQPALGGPDGFVAAMGPRGVLHPTWSPAGDRIAFTLFGTTNVVPSGGGVPQVLIPGESQRPSWSHTPGDNRIAFSRKVACGGDCSPKFGIWTFNPEGPGALPLLLIPNADFASYGNAGRIAVLKGDQIWTYGSNGLDGFQITSGAIDASPSLSDGVIAFQRLLSPLLLALEGGGPQWDIFLVHPDQQALTVTVDSPTPQNVRVDVFLGCGTTAFPTLSGPPQFPAFVGLEPAAVSGSTATFVANFDQSLAGGAAADCQLTFVATDGFDRNDLTDPDAKTTVTVGKKGPQVSIVSPRDGATFLQDATIPLLGTFMDPEDGANFQSGSVQWTLTPLLNGSPSGPPVPIPSATSLQFDAVAPAGGRTPGTYRLTLSASDLDGNLATAKRDITILSGFGAYTFLGFFAPVLNPPGVNNGGTGQSFPMKFQVQLSGQVVTDKSVVTDVSYQAASCGDFTPTGGLVHINTSGNSVLTFDSKTQQLSVSWQTPSAPGCYTFALTLKDGSSYFAFFKLK